MNREKLLAELEADEGVRTRLYFDKYGIPTIGIGRNLRKGISKATVYQMAHEDIDAVEVDLDQHLSWWRRLDETRQRVLANMCFNMGIARLRGFTKFLGYAFSGDYAMAAVEMLNSKWAKEDVAPERSLRLANMMRHGDAVQEA